MPDITWIKVSIGLFDDEKIKILESMPEKDTLLVIWIKLLIQAGKSNAGGYVRLQDTIPFTDEMLAAIFNRPLNTVRLALGIFQKFGMIQIEQTDGIFITNWAKYQNIETLDRVRELTRIRVNKHRLAMKATTCNADVTLQVTQGNVTVTQENKNRDRDTDKKEIEIEKERGIGGVGEKGGTGVNALSFNGNDISEKNNGNGHKTESQIILPEWINKETWIAFLEMRKKIKAPLTQYAMKLAIYRLERFRAEGENPNEILDKAIMGSWKGLYSLKDKFVKEKKDDNYGTDRQAIPGNRPGGAFAGLDQT